MSSYIDFRAAVERGLATYPTSNIYFLLDHGGLPGLRAQLLRCSLEWRSLFDCTLEENALDAAPILILAGGAGCLRMSRKLFEWIGKEGTYNSTTVMLFSPLQIDAMARRLAARLNIKLSEDMEAMLRFFDPRVLESLIRILSVEQSHVFFSPAEVWQYSDRRGELVSIDTIFDVNENYVSPLILNQKQEFALIDASEIDQVLDILRSNVPELTKTIPYSELYAFISRQIDAAKQCGIDSVLKLVIFIVVLLREGEKYVESPLWPRFLDKLAKDDFQFSAEFFSSSY